VIPWCWFCYTTYDVRFRCDSCDATYCSACAARLKSRCSCGGGLEEVMPEWK